MAYIAPSSAEQKVQAGYLARCSVQAAYEWLERRASKTSAKSRNDRSLLSSRPDLEEYVLLRRADRLIDIGLARYGHTERAVRGAYRRGGAACRIAAWSNVEARGSSLMTNIWANERDLLRLAERGSRHELMTMAGNPALGDSVLSSLIGRKEYFAALTDARWAVCISGLSKNPRLRQEYGPDRPMDGYAEHTHNQVFREAWGLAATLPAEQHWAALLRQLLRDCRIPFGMDKEADAILARWRIDKKRKSEDKYYNPGPSFYLRSRLADLLKPDPMLLTFEDRAVRLSFWKRFDPRRHPGWTDDMKRVFEAESEMDAHEALGEVMWNERLWQSQDLRETLRALCWSAPDRHHDMMMPNTYKGFLRMYAQKYPEWFRGTQPETDTTDLAPRPLTDVSEPAWVGMLAAKLDNLMDRSHDSAPKLVTSSALQLPAAARPWLSSVPWWVWVIMIIVVLAAHYLR